LTFGASYKWEKKKMAHYVDGKKVYTPNLKLRKFQIGEHVQVLARGFNTTGRVVDYDGSGSAYGTWGYYIVSLDNPEMKAKATKLSVEHIARIMADPASASYYGDRLKPTANLKLEPKQLRKL